MDATGAYAVFTFNIELEDGTTTNAVEYNDCRALVEEQRAILEISPDLPLKEAYNDAVPRLQNLLSTLAMPGEEPIETKRREAPRPEDEEDRGQLRAS